MLTDRSVAVGSGRGDVPGFDDPGGDPQSAYHTGLLAALYAVLDRGDDADGFPGRQPDRPPKPEPVGHCWRQWRAAERCADCASLVLAHDERPHGVFLSAQCL